MNKFKKSESIFVEFDGIKMQIGQQLADQLHLSISRSNFICIRPLYIAYPKCAKASHILSWSHWVELLEQEGQA